MESNLEKEQNYWIEKVKLTRDWKDTLGKKSHAELIVEAQKLLERCECRAMHTVGVACINSIDILVLVGDGMINDPASKGGKDT